MKKALVLALALLLPAIPAMAGESLWGRTVESLSFRGDAPIEEESFARLVALGPGQPLTERAVHASLRNLFATGRFADLSVEAAPAERGVAVTIVFSAAAQVAKVTSPGAEFPRRDGSSTRSERGRAIPGLRTAESRRPGRPFASSRSADTSRPK